MIEFNGRYENNFEIYERSCDNHLSFYIMNLEILCIKLRTISKRIYVFEGISIRFYEKKISIKNQLYMTSLVTTLGQILLQSQPLLLRVVPFA